MSAAALAQPADAPNAPPAQLSGPNGGCPPRARTGAGPAPESQPPGAYAQGSFAGCAGSAICYCRRDAAALPAGYATRPARPPMPQVYGLHRPAAHAGRRGAGARIIGSASGVVPAAVPPDRRRRAGLLARHHRGRVSALMRRPRPATRAAELCRGLLRLHGPGAGYCQRGLRLWPPPGYGPAPGAYGPPAGLWAASTPAPIRPPSPSYLRRLIPIAYRVLLPGPRRHLGNRFWPAIDGWLGGGRHGGQAGTGTSPDCFSAERRPGCMVRPFPLARSFGP